jgi:hypothetical protein
MKKFVSTVPGGGAPIFAQELVSDILTTEVWDAVEALLSKVDITALGVPEGTLGTTNNNFILSGGVVSDAGGGDRNITAGIAYFGSAGGIIARFPAVTSFTPASLGRVYINLDSPTTEQKTYFDGSDKDYSQTYTATISDTAGTDYVYGNLSLTTAQLPSLFTVLEYVKGYNASDMKMVRYDIGTWNMNRSAAGTAQQDIAVSAGTGDTAYIQKDNIVMFDATILQDDTTLRQRHKIDAQNAGDIWVVETDDPSNAFTIRLQVNAGSFFDSASYDGTSESRGWVTVWYIDQ